MPSSLLPPEPDIPGWTFLSNHTHVLVCLHLDPGLRLRDIAQIVRITERSVIQIIGDLEDAGVVSHRKEGRRNHYTVNPGAKLRHPLESSHTVGELLKAVAGMKRKPV